jgi:capsular exopolysaccharide synthesis family protein
VTDDGSLGAEKYRVLATRLNHLQEQRSIKRVVVTSSSSREGKSVTVSNLALTLSRRLNKRVLLIDGDLRQPTLSKLFGIGQWPGISDWHLAQKPIGDYLVRISTWPLWILPSGAPPEHPLDLLQSARMPEVMNQFMGWFDWILIDSPPVLPMADLALWSRQAEAVIMVVRQGHTTKKFLTKAVEALDMSKLLGVVLNEGTESHHEIYQSYYRTLKKNREPKAESQD